MKRGLGSNKDIPLNHKFFKTENHYINYCLKVIKEKGIVNERLTRETLELFSWTLANEKMFSTLGTVAPHSLLTWALKGSEDIDTVLDENIDKIRLFIEDRQSFPNVLAIAKDKGYTAAFLALLVEANGRCGVYKLFNRNEELIYVGKSSNLASRIQSSLSERKGVYVSFLFTENNSDACVLEAYYIAKYKPIKNSLGKESDVLSFEIDYPIEFTEKVKVFDELFEYPKYRNKKKRVTENEYKSQ